jgi:transcriptional regulator with XRE-family HTH domain
LTNIVNLLYIGFIVDFPTKLKLLRSERNLGIKALARDLGISYTYISHIERGKAKPSEELVKKLAAFFQVDEEELLVSAGKFPSDVEKILYEHPHEIVMLLRESFGHHSKALDNS